MRKSSLSAACLLAIGLAAPSAVAAPVTVVKDLAAAAPSAQAEPVHFNHRSCQLGARGWHFHRRGDRNWCRPFRRGY
jgi:hypothetical protein